MRTLSIIIFSLVFGNSFSQTKLISHKSHSGSNESFRVSIEENLFDIGDSNLGEGPSKHIEVTNLDSVIYVNPKECYIVTTNQTLIMNWQDDNEIKNVFSQKSIKTNVEYKKIFMNNHFLDSVKKNIKNKYYFKNNIENTIFVGYDNDSIKSKKKSIIPFTKSNFNFPTKNFSFVIWFGLVLLISIFTWKIYNSRKLI